MKILWKVMLTRGKHGGIGNYSRLEGCLPRAASVFKLRVLNPRKSCYLQQTGTVCLLPAANVKGSLYLR